MPEKIALTCPRCGKDVDEHEAGRETDACFAEVVLGHTLQYIDEVGGAWWSEVDGPNMSSHVLHHYSTPNGIALVWPGVERMESPALVNGVFGQGDKWHVGTKAFGGVYAFGPHVELAIVRACLKAMIAEKENDSA